MLGCGYGLAAALTGLAILLAASPPSTGPLGPASELILTVLGFNLVLILALTLVVFLRRLPFCSRRAVVTPALGCRSDLSCF